MRRMTIVLAAAAALAGCGGGRGAEKSTTAAPQGAAKLWMEAAIARNDARVQELSVDEFKEKSVTFAAEIREKFSPGDEFRWGGSGQEGEDFAWSAVGPGGVVFLKVRKAGSEYKVSEVSTSW